jgi:hypothetical protein
MIYLYQNRYAAIVNPLFWVVVLFLFYFQVPSIFVSEINVFFDWFIQHDNIFISLLISNALSVFFACLLLTVKVKNHSILIHNANSHCSSIVKFIWWGILIYLIFVVIYKFHTENLYMNDEYTGEVVDIFKLKNLAYLLLPVSIYCFFDRKNVVVFIPNILLVVLDLLTGSRTTALIAIVPVAVSFCLNNKKLYITPIVIMISALIGIGLIRSSNVVQDVPWYLNSIGEFRETYITLPLLIGNDRYIGHGDLYTLIASPMLAFLQPMRGIISESIVLPGEYIYGIVDRGYGLGANIITESLFYGYTLLFLVPVAILFLCMIVNHFISSSDIPKAAIHISMFIIFMRLIFREGFYYNAGLYLFVFAVYVFPIIVINRIRVSE